MVSDTVSLIFVIVLELYFTEFMQLQNKIENNPTVSQLIMMHIIGIHKVLRCFFPGVKCWGGPEQV